MSTNTPISKQPLVLRLWGTPIQLIMGSFRELLSTTRAQNQPYRRQSTSCM